MKKNAFVLSIIFIGFTTMFSCKKHKVDPTPTEKHPKYQDTVPYCKQLFALEIQSADLIEDTYVLGYKGGNLASAGSENTLHTGSWRGIEDIHSAYFDNIIYLKFDYAKLPLHATINEAFITLYVDTVHFNSDPKYSVYGHSIEDTTKTIVVSNVTSAWSEATLNYFNQPTSSNINATLQSVSKNQFREYTFDVTKLLKDQLIKGNNGFKIAMTTPSGYNLLRFASSENIYPFHCPRMFISYE